MFGNHQLGCYDYKNNLFCNIKISNYTFAFFANKICYF